MKGRPDANKRTHPGADRHIFFRPAASGVPVTFFTLVVKAESLVGKLPSGPLPFVTQPGGPWVTDGVLYSTVAMAPNDFNGIIETLGTLGLGCDTQPVDFYVLEEAFILPGSPAYLTPDDGHLGFCSREGKQYVYLKTDEVVK